MAKRDQNARHFGEMKDGTPENTASGPGTDQDNLTPEEMQDAEWLRRASDAYAYTTDWMSSGVRRKWEDNISRFNNEHPPSSKYQTEAYKKRSRIYRPKTRSNARRLEAKAAAAMFSNMDVVDARAQNRNSADGAMKARLGKELLQYRLDHTIPWFLTCIGALQNTFNYGVCISRQGWAFETKDEIDYEIELDDNGQPFEDDDGNLLGREIKNRTIVKDEPECNLLAVENFRFDPNADWRDPIGTSPVLIELIPMYAGEVQERMDEEVDEELRWRSYSLGEIVAAGGTDKQETESVRMAREGRTRTDSRDTAPKILDYTPVWVHLNTVRVDGQDWSYYTLGDSKMLSDPIPTEEMFALGREAYTLGYSVIETHKAYPSGGNELGAGLQEAINDIANQRFDNVKLVLNKRHFIRRNSGVDLKALARNVPGGSVFMGNPEADVRVVETPDVTGSSYQEQDRANVEMDELTGNFSGSSVQSNRQLNETVGGMQMLKGDAGSVSDLELMIFKITWAQPVLRKLYKLLAEYETDATVLAIAAENAELWDKYGISEVTDDMLDRELIISINVGMGNADPMMRVQKLSLGINTISGIPGVGERMNGEEVSKEVFGALGFGDGERFLIPAEEVQPQGPEDTGLQEAQIKAETDRYQAELNYQLGMAKLALEESLTLEELYSNLGLEQKKLELSVAEIRSKRDIKAIDAAQRNREMNIKEAMGSGI